MSVRLMALVFKCNMPMLKTDKGKNVSDSSCKFVLLALADHASDEGEGAYPGVKAICRKTNLSTQTVVHALNALRYNGFTRLEGPSKRRTFNYSILSSRIVRFQWVESYDSTEQNPRIPLARTNPSLNPHKPSIAPAARSLDIVDGMLKYEKPSQTLISALAQYFPFNVNWRTKTARQWLEWAHNENVTPEQIRHAAEVWKSDKRFNWGMPSLQKLFENWPALMGKEINGIDESVRVKWQQEVDYE